MQGTRMNFLTKEDAIAFAEKQGIANWSSMLIVGWEYYIQEPHNRQVKPKAYATNFNYCMANSKILMLTSLAPSKLRVLITK
jgi:NADH dehydrogenase (ubiquinone) Fe-S protein 4